MIRPLIATPCLGHMVCLNYHESIISLGTTPRPDIEISFFHLGQCSMIHLARNTCAKALLDGPYTHLFFIDSDIGFEEADFYRFIDSGHDVVGGVYPVKMDGGGTAIPRPEGNERFVEVDRAGTGFMCIRRNVFETMIKEMPTTVHQNEEGIGYGFFDTWGRYGEDFAFCARWKKLGGKIFADSKAKFTHQGMKLYV